MTPERFAKRIKAIARDIPANTTASVNRAAGLILATVIPSTPVDTGRARGNWQVNIFNPITSEIERLDKTGGATLTAGRQTIATRPPGATIYISNNVNYIGRLNEGWSAQAPANFVEKAVQTAIAHIRNARIVR